MAEDFVIEMLHITKEFPGIKANDDITLQLRKGEVHALLGENGAGKSTTIKLILDMLQRDGGTVTILGRDSRTASVRTREEIGVVLGSEGSGVSQLVKKLCDGVVRLDMAAQGTGVDSYNVSVAAGIILYEIQSQRAAQQA